MRNFWSCQALKAPQNIPWFQAENRRSFRVNAPKIGLNLVTEYRRWPFKCHGIIRPIYLSPQMCVTSINMIIDISLVCNTVSYHAVTQNVEDSSDRLGASHTRRYKSFVFSSQTSIFPPRHKADCPSFFRINPGILRLCHPRLPWNLIIYNVK